MNIKRIAPFILATIIFSMIVFVSLTNHDGYQISWSKNYLSDRFKDLRCMINSDSKETQLNSELENFFLRKESQYEQRRQLINALCRNPEGKFFDEKQIARMNSLEKGSMAINLVDDVSYCNIPKCASSTWTMHFLKMTDVDEETLKQWSLLSLLDKKLAPGRHAWSNKVWGPEHNLPDREVIRGFNKTLSLIIHRNPLSRLQSVYYQKFIDLGNSSWKGKTDQIISSYRKEINTKFKQSLDQVESEIQGWNKNLITPKEFIYHILNGGNDQHWQFQFLRCGICRLNYDIYAKVEELLEDGKYFVEKSGLSGVIDYKTQENKNLAAGNSALSKEASFWRSVGTKVMEEIISHYKMDFIMFDYDPVLYAKETCDMNVSVNFTIN